MDGELLDIKTGADEAAPFGSAQQLKRKQREAPGTFFETGSRGDAICLTTTPLHRKCGRSDRWHEIFYAIWHGGHVAWKNLAMTSPDSQAEASKPGAALKASSR
jgi:hypothetical protein